MRRSAANAGRALMGLALVGLSACERPTVEGSLGELLDLTYQDVRFTFSPAIDFTLPPEQRLTAVTEMSVRYTTPQGDGENVIWSVSARVGGDRFPYPTAWAEAVEIDISEAAGRRGSVTRNILDEPGRNFPRIERGTFFIALIPFPGRPMNGRFSVTFENGTEFASGRTVFHDFEAEIETP